MSKGLLKFKRKVHMDAFIKSLIIGVSLGLVIFSTLLILHKREIIVFQPIYSVLVGVGTMLLMGGLLYWMLLPRDKQLAKRLDEELGLQERAQTMLAFKKSDGAMERLQREDTDERLYATPISRLPFGKIWGFILLGLLSIAMFITSICVPAIIPQDPDFNLNDWQKLSLENLIEYVEDSDMQESPKVYTIDELNDLLSALDRVEKESVMKTHVVQAIVNVDGKIDEVNSCTALRNALGQTADANAIKLTSALKELQGSASVEALKELRAVFTYDAYVSTVAMFTEEVQMALEDSGYDENDGLYASIVGFLTDLQTVADEYGTHTSESLEKVLGGENGIGGIFTSFADEAHAALVQQKSNRRVANYVQTELMSIFKLTDEDIPDLENDEEENFQEKSDEENEDDKGAAPGAPDDGKINYGSNDLIFDPERGFVHYGEVLTDYENIMDEWLQDDNVPQEVKDMIRDYFNSL